MLSTFIDDARQDLTKSFYEFTDCAMNWRFSLSRMRPSWTSTGLADENTPRNAACLLLFCLVGGQCAFLCVISAIAADQREDSMKGVTAIETKPASEPALNAKGAKIVGEVLFLGAPPEEKPVDLTRVPDCTNFKATGPATRRYAVGTNGAFANVFVYVKSGLEDRNFAAPQSSVTLRHKNCFLEPRMFGIQVGQTLEILNNDPTLHAVHCICTNNHRFDIVTTQGMRFKVTFEKPEILVLKCAFHTWERAYCGVLAHPFFDTTREDGRFEIQDLPPGTYVIEAWHARAGAKTLKVKVLENETKRISFTFPEGADLSAVLKNEGC